MKRIPNHYEFGQKQNPTSIVFLLHGLGSNGQDLISLAPLWAKSLPQALFISPDAPFPCDMAPYGFQWFSLQSRDPEFIREGIKIAAPILQSFMEEQASRLNVPFHKTALGSFSQGTMMSLYTAPRLPELIAGVVGYSGALFGEEDIGANPESFKRPPIHLIHGEADDVVPVTAYHHARNALTAANFRVTGHTTPRLTHSIDDHGITSGGSFLQEILA